MGKTANQGIGREGGKGKGTEKALFLAEGWKIFLREFLASREDFSVP